MEEMRMVVLDGNCRVEIGFIFADFVRIKVERRFCE